MGDNAVNEDIEEVINTESEEIVNKSESLSLVIQELGEATFLRYPDKTSNLTSTNIKGMLKISALNDLVERRYGFRYTELDTIVTNKKALVLSQNGYGLTKFIEVLNAIKAEFAQIEGGMGRMGGLSDLTKRR
jgi:hypothetical protein